MNFEQAYGLSLNYDIPSVAYTTGVKTDDYDECVRCGDDADGTAKYEFDEHRGGPETFDYCAECAQSMHERYEIDHVVDGDLGLED